MIWDEEEILKLRDSFVQGCSLKIMARQFERSPGAVNKALTRFNIRPTQYKVKKPIFPPLNYEHKKPRTPKPYMSLKETASWQYTHKHILKGGQDKPWVSWYGVLAFLKRNGYKVKSAGAGANVRYMLNGRAILPKQLLIQANKERVEQNLAPYHVENMTDCC